MKTKKRTNANQPKETRGIRALFGLSQPAEGRATRSHATYRAVKGVASGSAHAVSKGSANSATTSTANSAAASTTSSAKKGGILASAMAVLLAGALVFSGLQTAFAAIPGSGNGGNTNSSPTVNTFASGMNLQEVYINLSGGGGNAIPVSGSKVKLNGTNATLSGSELVANGETTFGNESWKYVYQNGAELYDGTKADVEVIYTLKSVITGTSTSFSEFPGDIYLSIAAQNFNGNITNASNGSSTIAYMSFVDVEVRVVGADGLTYIIPVNGFNQSKGTGGAWSVFASDISLRSEGFSTSETIYTPVDNTFSTSNGRIYTTSNPGESNYKGGFAIEGSSGRTVTINQTAGKQGSGTTQTNNLYLRLGDLQRRIESWSGDHGTIKTGKPGTGTDLDGEGSAHEHYKYVVPFYKSGVTYTMIPDTGYTADEITVDGSSVAIPENPSPGTTWGLNNTDGVGTITYVGGGKFTYVFEGNNTQDHTITVTWKKETADIQVTKFWNDNGNSDNKRPSTMPEIELTSSDGKTHSPLDVADADAPTVVQGDSATITWAGLDVWEYDSDGKATNKITYTLKENADPASSDYVKAVWNGPDYEGGAPESSFTLTNPNNDNKIRETDDPYKASVTNTVKRDVEITKKWDDNDNRNGLRPAANDMIGSFTLYEDSTKAKTVTADQVAVTDNGDNTFTVKWSGVAAYGVEYDASGTPSSKDLTYFAQETTVPEGYTITQGASGVNEKGTIVNELNITDFTVYKKWNDGAVHKDRPTTEEQIADFGKNHFTIYQDGTAYTKVEPSTIIHDTNHDLFVIKWEGLPQKKNGVDVVYTASETAVPTGYSREADDNARLNDGDTVTNTLLKDVEFTKKWADEGYEADRPAADGTAGNYSLYNDAAMATPITQVTINGADTAVSATVTRSGDVDTIKYTNLPAYDSNGDEINYYIKETTTPSGYVVTEGKAGVAEAGNITNTVNKQSIEVTKVWNDADLLAENADVPAGGSKYERKDVTFNLTASYDSTTVDENKTITTSESDTKDTQTDGTYKVDDNTFVAVFKDLPRFDSNDAEITYTVKENAIGGADPEGAGGVAWTISGGTLTEKADGSGKETTITNTPVVDDTYNPITLTISKTDKNTNTGLANATFTVYTDASATTKATATGDDAQVSANEVTTNGSGTATITFKKSGTYYLKETTAPTGYQAESGVLEFDVDTELQSINLKSADAEHTQAWWERLYDLIFGKTPTATDTVSYSDDNKTLTVKDEPITANILARKTWEDSNNQDNLRTNAANATVTLEKSTDNGATWDAVSATAAPARTIPATDGSVIVNDEDHYTWENLPAYESGKLVLYRVKETGTLITGDALTGYAYTAKTASDSKEEFPIATVSGTTATPMSRTVNVQNTHTPQTIQIKVTKTWSDDSTAKRTTADVKLYKTVNRVETLVDTKTGVVPTTDGDAVTFMDLPAYENGQAITYRVEESDVSGYKTSYATSYTDASGTSQNNATGSVDATDIQRTYDGSGTTKVETTSGTVAVTNTELTDVEVEKTWIDGANANVTFELWRTAKPEADLTTSAFKNEAITLDDGKEVTVQTWKPDTADGWEKVAEHEFSASEFAASSEGSTQTYTFKDLDKKDANGNKYLYRVLETTDGSFTKDQKGNLAVTNTNTNPSSGLAYANVVKELQGRNWKDDDEFWFWLAPIKGVDSSGKPIEFSPSERSSTRSSGAPYPLLNNAYNIRDIPMPEGSTLSPDSHGALFVDAKAKATVETTQVGAIGHVVSFSPIAFTEQDVGTWYYLISESLDEAGAEWPEPNKSYDGITYALNDDGTKCKESVLKVVVSNDNGKITTELYWDGSDQQSAVPVFTNTYEATAEISPYVVKKVDGRDYKSGDSFQVDMVNLAGSPMRETKAAEGTTEPSTKIAATITNSDGSSVYVSASGSNYQDSGATSGDTKAAQSSVHTWIKTSDLTLPAKGQATGVFVYELSENPASEAADDDLIFDTNKLYMKVAVTDNEDGTLNTTTTYWLDAACTEAATPAKVLVYKKGDNKGKLAPANADATDTENYEYVPAAYFENTKTADVTVKKQWVIKDGDEEKAIEPIDNATVQLYRYKVASLDNLDSLPTNIDVWEPVSTHTFDRGDFYTATIKGETYTQTQAAAAVSRGDLLPEDVSGASWTYDSATLPTYVFEDLPLYTTNADGAQLQYVYRALEVSGSEAYDVTYSTDGSTWTDKWTETGNLRDGELTIKNTVTATNTANVAAVKQLLGRNWAASDDFSFTLKPTGKATYGDDGEINGTDTTDETIAKIPVPKTDEDRDSSTTGQVATTHAKQDTNKYPAVDPNGGLERLGRFGAITYTVDDLVYDEKDGHMQGDFFYEMKETIPEGAQAYNKTSGEKVDGATYSDSTSDADRKAYAWKQNGITYDGDVHTVHVKVRENKTSELVVQVAYDETTKGDISTGTQFTPVYTNKYDAEGTAEANIYKYVMGRSWKSGDSFTFSAQPLGGAPFVNAETGEAITSDYTKTITVSDTSQTRQAVALDALKFTLDNLPWTVGVAGAKDASDPYSTGAITYSDGTTPAEGTKYGIFMYAVAETVSSPDDLDKDEDTEYIQVIVIDKGDGTLDTKVQYCEDRLGQTIRKEAQTTAPYSDSSTDATGATFVNQLKRDINVTKAWADPATSDVVLKLQWSTVGGTSDADWNDADGTSWLADFAATKTIDQDAEGDELTVTWKGLPAYANLTNDDIDLNDEWIYYRVVEEPINNVDTRYSETAYANGDKKTDSKYRTAPYTTEAAGQDIVKDFYVTNFPKDLESETTFGVVKQFIGKVWESESFTFEVTPLKSKRGSEESYTDYNADTNPMPKFKAADESTSATATATANTATAAVSVNEHAANFDPLLIKLSDLAVNDDGVAYGEFEYKIKEVIPAGATKITEGSKTYYVVEDAQGNLIKYTGEEHTVKIKATNNGQDTIDTEVSFDGRNVGEFVPVYTNYAMMATPIEGTKTWVGGENADHVNGTLTLADNEITAATDSLGLVLQRASAKDNVKQDVATDDAGRQLKIVWVKETKTTEGDTTTITRTSQVGGDGSGPYTYTVKALDSNNNYVNPILSISDSEGYTYTYSIKEGTVPTNYAVSYDGMDVTNTYDVKDALYVSKIWNDAENAAGLRPNSVTMHLFKEVTITEQGGTSTTELVQVDVPEQEIVKGESSETSGIHWSGLPVYDASGNKIKYVVVEESVAGYTTEYQVDFTTDGNWKPEADDAVKVELNGTSTVQRVYVRNSMVPETDKVKVTKVWDDNSDAAKKRPANVEFILKAYEWNTTLNDGAGGYPSTPAEVTTRPATKADVDADVAEKEAAGQESTMKLGDDITVTRLKLDGSADNPTNQVANETAPTDANTWNGEWINLPSTKNGKPVYYVVEEVTTNTSVYGTGANKYSSTPCITGDQLSGYTVKNVFTPETTNATITKVWADNNNALDTRPATATFALYKSTDGGTTKEVAKDSDGNAITLTISADDQGADANTWTKTIDGLPKYEAVKTSGEGVTPETYESKAIIYYWQETVPVGYTAFGTAVVDPATATNADNAVAAGSTIKVADDPENVNDSVITNTIVPGAVQVVKTWDDSGDKDGKRAAAITAYLNSLTLFANDTRVTDTTAGVTKTVATDASAGTTTVTWTGLPVYSNGALVNYSVTEDAIPEYTMSVAIAPASVNAATDQATPAKITLTNQHIAGSTTHMVTKTWEDTSNKDGLRPTTADYKSWLKLYRTTQAAIDAGDDPVEVTNDYLSSLVVVDNGNNTFTATWNNLPAVDNSGNTYIYSSAEVLPANSYYQATTGEGDSAATQAAGQPEAKEIAIQNNAITNKQMLQNVVVRKVWNDKILDLATSDIIVNPNRPTSIDITLEGDDGDAEADPAVVATTRLATVSADSPAPGDTTDGIVGIYANDNFDYVFKMMPIYKADGITPVIYTLNEAKIPGYLTTNITVGNVKVLVNTYQVTKLAGVKEWKDDGRTHNNATEVQLIVHYQKLDAEGNPASGDGAVGTIDNPTVVWGTTEETKNNFQIVGLPVGDGEGNTYTYWVSEAEVAGYTTTYTGEGKTHSTTAEGEDGEETTTVDGILDGGTIKNETVLDSLSATKVWDDADNSRGLRPEDGKVMLHLYKVVTEGEEGSQTTKLVQVDVEPKTVTANSATATWADLPVYDGGVKIKYVVLEESVVGYTATYQVPGGAYVAPGDEPATNTGLQLELDGDTTAAVQNVNIKNALGEATSTVAVTKIWDDDDNVDGKRPTAGATFKLYKRVWDKQTQAYGAETQVTARSAVQADVTAAAAEDPAREIELGSTITLPNNGTLTLDGTADTENLSAYELTPTDSNTWKGQWLNLPTQENGQTVIYYVKEDPNPVSSDYETAVITGNQLDGFTATNKHVPETTNATITKNWVDNSNAMDIRPDTLALQLWRTYEGATEDEQVTVDASNTTIKTLVSYDDASATNANQWVTTIANLPVNKLVDGAPKKYTYYWKEVVPTGYTATGTYNDAATAAVVGNGMVTISVDNASTLTNTYKTGTLTVTKEWNDGNDVDKKRTAAIAAFNNQLTLYADGDKVTVGTGDSDVKKTSSTDTTTGKITVTYTNLPLYNSQGTKITYSADEGVIPEYALENTPSTSQIDDTTLQGATIEFKNKRQAETVDKPVRVTWVNDVDALDETSGSTGGVTPERPEQVTVTLQKKNADGKWEDVTTKADGTAIPSSITLDASKNLDGDPNNWGDVTTWTGLPKKDAAGNGIDYRVVQTGYKLPNQEAVSGGAAAADDATVAAGSTKPVDLAGYKTTPIAIDISGSLTTIVNLFETTTITGTKVWVDGNQKHNNSSELADAFTVYRTDKASPQDSDWTELAKDTDYHIDWSGTDDATFNIRGLAKYVDANADQKVEYRYKVTETAPAHYTASYTDASGNEASYLTSGGTVTNTAETVKVYAKKAWAGDADDKSKRAAITFQLTQANGDTTANVGDPTPATASAATFEPITDADNADCVVWENLPKYVGSTDTEYVYDVVETSVPEGYTSTKDGTGKSADDPIVITNTLGVDSINVPVMVKWNDGNDQDAIRPTSADVKLQQYVDTDDDGTPDTWQDVPGKTLTLNDSNNWKGSFDGLPKTDAAGAPIQYKVVEARTGTLTGTDEAKHYAIDEAGDPANPAAGFTIINTHTPEGALSISASKVWDDSNGGSAEMHTDVVLHLYGLDANGLVVYDAGTKKIAKDSGEAATWDGLPVYHFSNTALVWKVVEEAVPGYAASYSTEAAAGGETIAVTNTYTGPVTQVSVSKEWQDNNNVDGKRPEKITYELWQSIDGEEATKVEGQDKPVDVAADGTANATWANLPATKEVDDGIESATRVEYQDVTKYQDASGNTITADEYAALPETALDNKTNYEVVDEEADPLTYTNGTDTISADEYAELPDAPEPSKADYTETTVSEPQEVTEDVAKKKEVAIVYFVKEAYTGTALEERGYDTPVIEATGAGTFKAINKRDRDVRDITVQKVWSDGDNVDGMRPDHITFTLTGDTEIHAGKTSIDGIIEGDGSVTFHGLPVNKTAGEAVAYTVEETNVPDGYTAAVAGNAADGFTITNTYNPAAKLNVRATKVWVEDDGQPARSDVVLHLIQVIDGAEKDMGQNKTIAAGATGDALTVEWTDLPAVVDGKAVTYSVSEDAVTGYITTYSDGQRDGNTIAITVTNTKDAIDPDPDPDPEPEPTPTTRLPKVTYLDPKAADGSMILSAKEFADAAAAAAESTSKAGKPADPTHDGYEFVGWAVNQDEFGDYILVAKYNQKASEETPKVVSYIDPQTGELLVSEITGDVSSVNAPSAPSHDNLKFVGWEEVVDANGNHVFVAKYEPDCSNAAGETKTVTKTETVEKVIKEPAAGSRSSTAPSTAIAPQAVGQALAKTGDEAPVAALLAALLVSFMGVVFVRRRVRQQGAVQLEAL